MHVNCSLGSLYERPMLFQHCIRAFCPCNHQSFPTNDPSLFASVYAVQQVLLHMMPAILSVLTVLAVASKMLRPAVCWCIQISELRQQISVHQIQHVACYLCLTMLSNWARVIKSS